MEQGFLNTQPKFASLEEEAAYLRARIQENYAELEELKHVTDNQREAAAKHVTRRYQEEATEELLEDEYQLREAEVDRIVLDLEPEEHDEKMNELLALLLDKGIKNTLTVVGKMNNIHIEDDFHRLLVEYLRSGHPADGIKEGTALARALSMTLYEVVLPAATDEDKKRALKELVSSMEQFYAGMLSVGAQEKKHNNYFTVEVAVEHAREDVTFYVSVLNKHRELFEKQVAAIFPDADIREQKNDYNIFNEDGISVASYAASGDKSVFPIKTYEEFDYDPLNTVINAFSKIEREGEGAAIQLVLRPVGDEFANHYRQAISELEKGASLKEATNIAYSIGKGVVKEFGKLFTSTKKDDEDKSLGQKEQQAIEEINKKLESPILSTNLRLVSSAPNRHRAEEILHGLESAFNQFENTKGNRLEFTRVAENRLHQFLHTFSFRLFSSKYDLPLSIREITSFLHFPATDIRASRELKQSKAGTAPAPLDLPREGVQLGVNKYRGKDTPIFMAPEDRMRHMYVIGQTGTGKSVLLTNMIIQDIRAGDGCCFIDPHGSDVEYILENIPQERYDDVIYFDPANVARPMGLNMLEYDRRYPEQKTFVVNEMLSIFNKLFDMKTAGGPMFEQYFRNATMLVLEDPESGATLLEISRVLADDNFRKLKLSRSRNPMINQYWTEVAEKAGGEASLQNIVPYITSKFDVFMTNEIMRPIIAQEHSSLNFRDIMDKRKILLVNLSKGRLGDINANLLGLIIVGKFLMAALSRVDAPKEERHPFYLYIDEFQNITTDSISQILSEARKYALSLTVAHQFIAQLEEKIRDAVFGNVGSTATFRVSSEDAEFLEKQYAPVFTARDIMNIPNWNCYMKMLAHGQPIKPFSMETLPPPEGSGTQVNKLKELSSLKFGRPRAEIEDEIMRKYQKTQQAPDTLEPTNPFA